MHAFIERLARLFINKEKKGFEKCVELEQRRDVMKQDVTTAATAPHTPTPAHTHTHSSAFLMAGLTELTLADELSLQTQFESFLQNTLQTAK